MADEGRSAMAEVFVQLADISMDEFDVVDFLQQLCNRCVELLDVDAAGLLLADPNGVLQVVAATSEGARLMELFQLQAREGPCLDAFRYGAPVMITDIAMTAERWPRFVPAAALGGFASVHAIPMRAREQVLGAVNLFGHHPGGLDAGAVRVARALTDVATIALLRRRATHDQTMLVEQLRTALTSRVVIEQAKGALARRLGGDPEQAFAVLRAHARRTNRRLTDVSRAVVAGTDDIPRRGADTEPRDRG